MVVFAKDQTAYKASTRATIDLPWLNVSCTSLSTFPSTKMKLLLKPALPQDLENAKSIYGSDSGDLVAPAHSAFWHVENDCDAKKRAEWSLQQQKEQLENDPFARFVKVVDEDNDEEIVAMGRWHDFPNGNEQVVDLEYSGLKSREDPAAWPDGFPREAYLKFYDECLAARKEWQGNVHCWGMYRG